MSITPSEKVRRVGPTHSRERVLGCCVIYSWHRYTDKIRPAGAEDASYTGLGEQTPSSYDDMLTSHQRAERNAAGCMH